MSFLSGGSSKRSDCDLLTGTLPPKHQRTHLTHTGLDKILQHLEFEGDFFMLILLNICKLLGSVI